MFQTLAITILSGIFIGAIVQYVILQNIANGKWAEISNRRKRGQVMSGALGGVIAGLVYISNNEQVTSQTLVKILLWQFGGGFLGLGVFEALELVKRMRGGGNAP